MGRRFVGEKNYNALPVAFVGRPWEVMAQTVHGRIAAIAPHLVIPSRARQRRSSERRFVPADSGSASLQNSNRTSAFGSLPRAPSCSGARPRLGVCASAWF